MLISIIALLSRLSTESGFQIPKCRRPVSVALAGAPSAAGSNTELWLDLRGTRLFPSTALKRLEEDFGVASMVDRVVLWDDGSMNGNDDVNSEHFIFVGANGHLTSRPSGMSGIMLSIAETGFTDPIAAMETNSKGGWVLIDSMHISDNEARLSGVRCIVELLVAGSAGGSSGVLLLGDSRKECTGIFEKGGIALTCPTKADVFHAAATLESLQSSSTTTKSGILVPNSPSEASDYLRLQSAVVIPFDGPWETALIVFRNELF